MFTAASSTCHGEVVDLSDAQDKLASYAKVAEGMAA